jgi:D-xylose transport system substrate-binding protein
MTPSFRRRAVWLAALALTLPLAACGEDDETPASGEPASSGGKVALLLPESKTTRYETQDRPNFERRLNELCPECEVFYQNADQDAAKQQRQVEAAITEASTSWSSTLSSLLRLPRSPGARRIGASP